MEQVLYNGFVSCIVFRQFFVIDEGQIVFFFKKKDCCFDESSLFVWLWHLFVGGKSAILTALCVAFGCRAKGTQRASTLKDFIKTGAR